jgi:hypothetical protein
MSDYLSRHLTFVDSPHLFSYNFAFVADLKGLRDEIQITGKMYRTFCKAKCLLHPYVDSQMLPTRLGIATSNQLCECWGFKSIIITLRFPHLYLHFHLYSQYVFEVSDEGIPQTHTRCKTANWNTLTSFQKTCICYGQQYGGSSKN